MQWQSLQQRFRCHRRRRRPLTPSRSLSGFFPVLDGNSRGNFGLMDQVAALHWIQENIQEFGGDPSAVAIAGHGFGAACVHLLMLSPMAKGKP